MSVKYCKCARARFEVSKYDGEKRQKSQKGPGPVGRLVGLWWSSFVIKRAGCVCWA